MFFSGWNCHRSANIDGKFNNHANDNKNNDKNDNKNNDKNDHTNNNKKTGFYCKYSTNTDSMSKICAKSGNAKF